jgi:hydroxyacylglutathione hydrolase
MRILTVVAPVFGTNCYLMVADDGVACVVVDAGAGVSAAVEQLVARAGLHPVAVLATHGHVDHTWDAAALCETYDVDLRLHAADAYRLTDPFGTLGVLGAGVHDTAGPLAQALSAVGMPPASYRPPARVRTFDAGADPIELDLSGARFGGASLRAWHAPGHTEGATLYLAATVPGAGSVLPDSPSADALVAGATATALTGDVLFAGTIGRTDLPGGHGPTMVTTLRERVARLAPTTLVLPGHGPASRMDLELRGNRYLAGGLAG